jgi:DNA-binding response OmpR family regulator
MRSRSARTKSIPVLLVEDDKPFARAVKKSLEMAGFSVDLRLDGSAALDSLKRVKKYEVLIFDNEMDGINGIGLARQARELNHRSRTPIIVFSSDDVATEAYRAGVSLFLQKPHDLVELTSNIKQLLSN